MPRTPRCRERRYRNAVDVACAAISGEAAAGDPRSCLALFRSSSTCRCGVERHWAPRDRRLGVSNATAGREVQSSAVEIILPRVRQPRATGELSHRQFQIRGDCLSPAAARVAVEVAALMGLRLPPGLSVAWIPGRCRYRAKIFFGECAPRLAIIRPDARFERWTTGPDDARAE